MPGAVDVTETVLAGRVDVSVEYTVVGAAVLVMVVVSGTV